MHIDSLISTAPYWAQAVAVRRLNRLLLAH
jgi:hypothetical protein